MRKLTLQVFLISYLLLNFTLMAQNNWVYGEIYQKGGGVLDVEIDYRNWDENPKMISARKNDQVLEFSPDEISGFQVSGEWYRSYIGDVVDMPVSENLQQLDVTEIPLREESVFLFYLIKGDKSLLTYKDAKGNEHFFYEGIDEMPVELKYYKFRTKEEGQGLQREMKKYRQQLSDYFPDCANSSAILSNVTYTRMAMKNTFVELVRCAGSSVSFRYKRKKAKIAVGPAFVGYMSTYTYSGTYQNGNSITRIESLNDIGSYFGGFLSYEIPRTNRKLHAELAAGLFNLQASERIIVESSTFSDDYIYSTEMTYFNLSIGGKYQLIKFGTVPINVGVGARFAFGEPETLQQWRRYDGGGNLTQYQVEAVLNPEDIRGIDQGVYAYLSADIWMFTLLARGEFGNGYSSNSTLEIQSRNLGFGLRFNF